RSAGQTCAVTEGGELGPGDAGHDLGRAGDGVEAAVHTGKNVLFPQDISETPDALGHRLGVLDDVGGRVDDAGNDHLAVGHVDVLPPPPSHSWRPFAATTPNPAGRAVNIRSTMLSSGRSLWCGASSAPQQRWIRIMSGSMLRAA